MLAAGEFPHSEGNITVYIAALESAMGPTSITGRPHRVSPTKTDQLCSKKSVLLVFRFAIRLGCCGAFGALPFSLTGWLLLFRHSG